MDIVILSRLDSSYTGSYFYLRVAKGKIFRNTPPKISMEPKTWPIEKENHLPNRHFFRFSWVYISQFWQAYEEVTFCSILAIDCWYSRMFIRFSAKKHGKMILAWQMKSCARKDTSPVQTMKTKMFLYFVLFSRFISLERIGRWSTFLIVGNFPPWNVLIIWFLSRKRPYFLGHAFLRPTETAHGSGWPVLNRNWIAFRSKSDRW